MKKDEQEKWCKLTISNTVYVVPVDDALEVFRRLAGCEIQKWVTVSGEHVDVIVSPSKYEAEVKIESLSDFDRIQRRAMGETYLKESEGKT